MSTKNTHRRRLWSLVVGGAVVLGVAAGSYGIASAATGTSSSNSSSSLVQAAPAANAATANAGQPWGRQRPDETVQTGDAASKIRAAALAKVPGATIVRVETDADGNAKYEAHIVKPDGTPATVYVDASFNAVSVASR